MHYTAWHDRIWCAIVRALCSAGLASVCGAQPDETVSRLEFRELEQEKKRAEQESAEANAELAAVRQDLRDARRRFADQYLENRSLQNRLAALDWAAANLLQADGHKQTMPTEAFLLRYMEKRREIQRNLHRKLVRLRTDVQNAETDSTRASVVSDEWLTRLDQVIEQSRQLKLQPPAVAGRGGGDDEHKVLVLTVNDELQAVIVNRGRTDGVMAASTWTPTGKSSDDLILKIIATGERFSVAVPLRGSLRLVGPGSSLTRQKNADEAVRPQ